MFHQRPRAEVWLFVVRVAERFQFKTNWYRQEEPAQLVLEYYLVLRAVFRAKPHLRLCLARCRHCRIFFLTHFRNAGRNDLRCPFGCRLAYRRQQSTRRSVAYYREAEGKVKKRDLNQRRAPGHLAAQPEPARPEVPVPSKLSAIVVAHVQMALSLIEGRRVSRALVLVFLGRVLRQHSMEWRRQRGDAQGRPDKRPP